MKERFWQDVRYGLRLLIKNRLFTLVAVITLALGIGATTAIFSVINATILRPLSYPNPGSLVMVWDTFNSQQSVIAAADFLEYRDQSQIFEGQAAAFEPFDFDLIESGDPERINGYRATANLFEVLGVKPHLGRTFLPQEDQPGAPPVVILSYGLWQRRFNSDPNILGRTLKINEQSYNVVGVMPMGFKFPPPLPLGAKTFFIEAEMWSSLAVQDLSPQDHRLFAIARLKQGVSPKQASLQISSIASRPEQNHPKNTGAIVVPLETQAIEHIRTVLLVLLGVVSVILLISCANIANLLLARVTSREKEIAIRIAIGAKHSQIIRQLLTESLLLSLLGGSTGLLLAYWGVDLLWAMTPQEIRYFNHATLDIKVLGFTLMISVLTTFIFGLAPALQSSRPQLTETLKEGRVGGVTSSSRRRWGNILIATEVGLALILLIGAGLLIRSFTRLLSTEFGFDPNNVLTMNIALPAKSYSNEVQQKAFFDKLLNNLKQLPGVQNVGAIEQLPIAGGRLSTKVALEGYPEPASISEAPQVEWYTVTPDYFHAMNIPLLGGRFFEDQDIQDAPSVVIISEMMASKYWPGVNPVGKRIRTRRSVGGKGRMEWSPWATIIGVTGNVRRRVESNPVPTIYLPYSQNPTPEMAIVLRTVSDPQHMAETARKEVWALDRNLIAAQVRPMAQIVADAEAQPRFRTFMLGIFAFIALILSAVGVYGVTSYSVAQRLHEIGIRMALGANQSDILKLIVGEALLSTLIGVVIGLSSAYALTRVISSFLYGITATDPITFLSGSLLIIGIVLLASYIPARRATKVDPILALQNE